MSLWEMGPLLVRVFSMVAPGSLIPFRVQCVVWLGMQQAFLFSMTCNIASCFLFWLCGTSHDRSLLRVSTCFCLPCAHLPRQPRWCLSLRPCRWTCLFLHHDHILIRLSSSSWSLLLLILLFSPQLALNCSFIATWTINLSLPFSFFFRFVHGVRQARVPAELLNRLEPYFTPEFKETSRVEELNSGAEDAAALREENTWKQIAKKRLKTSSLDEEAPVAVPK